jgi:hypothetical protein
MKVVMTVCSREKDRATEDLPAYARYTSKRVSDARAVANSKGLPFFILSGKYGLVAENDTIPYYDHLLTQDEVVGMATLVANQNQDIRITEIEFHARPRKGDWAPYYKVIERMAIEQGIKLEIVTI